MRNLDTDMQAAFEGAAISPTLMAEFQFDSQTIGMFTGYGNLTWNGIDFSGSGNLAGISNIEETEDLEAKGIVLSLNGMDSTLLATVFEEKLKARKCNIYLGANAARHIALEESEGEGAILLEDGSGYIALENDLLDTPVRLFSGLMDVAEINDTGSEGTIKLSVENILYIGQRAKLSRYTDAEQKRRYPDDRGLEGINELQNKEIVW